MKIKDQFSFIFQQISKNKLRIGMTILATTIGCAFLIILSSVGFGLQKTLTDSILNQEDITKINFSSEANLTSEDIKKIESLEHVNTVLDAYSFEDSSRSNYKNRSVDSNLFLYDFSRYSKLPNMLSEGVYPTQKNEVVVGFHYAQTLLTKDERKLVEEKEEKASENNEVYDRSNDGLKESIIGKEIELYIPARNPDGTESKEQPKKMKFKVVGIQKEPAYDWVVDNSVIASKELSSAFDKYTKYNVSKIYVDAMPNVLSTIDELKSIGYKNIYSPIEEVEQTEKFFLIIKIGLVFVGTIAVLIASIGIFNTMTMAVTERTREIGVLKAIGASPNLIQRLFLMESAFIGIIGTVFAVIISYVVSSLVNLSLPFLLNAAMGSDGTNETSFILSYIPVSLVIIASFISILVALISGWNPARKATKVEVIKALRQEL